MDKRILRKLIADELIDYYYNNKVYGKYLTEIKKKSPKELQTLLSDMNREYATFEYKHIYSEDKEEEKQIIYGFANMIIDLYRS